VVCATDGFGLANQGATAAQQVDALAAIVERQAVEGGPPITATISVAFGCPFDGEVSEDQVVAIARDAAVDGRGRDRHRRHHRGRRSLDRPPRIEAVRAAAPDARLRMHFHDTRNTGLANAFASVEAGIDVLDASVGGLGGCPFAPNATGNIGTEDLVYMLERAGFETGYDLAP
jgi:hydroxymethylglutaryl-CoA lyase